MTDDLASGATLHIGEDGLAWREAGDPGAPPVVLLHGFPASSLLWRAFFPVLAPSMRVVAPDLFGGGESAAPADPGVGATVDLVRGLLERLGVEEPALVGHGHGGTVVRGLAAGVGARAIVLLDAFAGGEPPAWTSEREPAPAIAAMFRDGLGHPERLPLEVLESYAEPFVSDPARFERAASALERTPVAPALPDDVPTLFVWGEEDAYVSAERAEEQAEPLPLAALAMLPGCSHFLPEDAADTIVPLVLEYLRARYLGVSHHHEAGPVEVFLGRRPPPEAERIDT